MWKWKIANITLHQHTELLICHLLHTVEWLHLQFFKTYMSMSLFKWLELLSTNSFKCGIKMKRTFTCFPLYAFKLPFMKHFCEILLLKVQEFFAECIWEFTYWSLYIISVSKPFPQLLHRRAIRPRPPLQAIGGLIVSDKIRPNCTGRPTYIWYNNQTAIACMARAWWGQSISSNHQVGPLWTICQHQKYIASTQRISWWL